MNKRSGIMVGVLTVILTVVAFPSFDFPEAAYVWAVPLAFWATGRPSWRGYLRVSFLAGWVSWAVLLVWLRHVTWVGLVLLAAVLGVFFMAWAAWVRWCLPRMEGRSGPERVGLLALGAAGWVALEWLRGVILGGFPWLPLAASQWERPVLLQMLPWMGAAGLSFVLVFFNLALAGYLRLLLERREERTVPKGFSRWRLCPELYLAVALVLVQLPLYMHAVSAAGEREPVVRVGIVQPHQAVMEHFEVARVSEALQRLGRLSIEAARQEPDVILWPESALTLLPLKGDAEALAWAERLVRAIGRPVVCGALAEVGEHWYNALYTIEPDGGVQEPFYAKRKLVPFGEYVPLERWLPFIRKVVPFEGSFEEGSEPTLLEVLVGEGRTWKVGGLICYEDIFAELARESVAAGADVLAVVTNNAWFGEEGGAYQHAAHSVLRAVENRRVVVRCGNAGWSGWVDELGHVREVVEDEGGSVYFEGTRVMEVSRARRWVGQETFFTRHGEVFAQGCALACVLGALVLRRRRQA